MGDQTNEMKVKSTCLYVLNELQSTLQEGHFTQFPFDLSYILIFTQ